MGYDSVVPQSQAHSASPDPLRAAAHLFIIPSEECYIKGAIRPSDRGAWVGASDHDR